MKAVEAKLLEFLRKSPQFIIPIYQRNYSWTEKECRQLWGDVLRAGQDETIRAHFIGSVVYVEKGMYSVSSQSPLLVIDGQQRLTTLSLMICALAETLKEGEQPVEGFTRKKLRNYFLLNPEEEGDAYYKLLLAETDKATLLALLDGVPEPAEKSVRISENYAFFKAQLAANLEQLAAVCEGIAKLMLVDISLSREHDNPQLIFESMNSTGKALSQADLIRNYILMGLEHGLQTKLYQQYWRPMEDNFGQAAYSSHFDGFMRHYLTFRTREIPNIRQVYEAFKTYALKFAGDTEQLVVDIHRFSGYYKAMALGGEPDVALARAFHDLRELKVTVAYPLLLELYDDYQNELLSKEGLLQATRLIESYVFRRAICELPTNSMNKTFAQLGRRLKKDRYVESLQAELLLMVSYRRFPADDEFRLKLVSKDLYKFKNRSYWLRRLENHGRKERVSVDEYTVEHIMPQTLTPEWKEALGEEWKAVHGKWLHTLGNLTLTAYNSKYGNKLFATKRDMESGFRHSPLRVNQFAFEVNGERQTLGVLDVWQEVSIMARAAALATEISQVWGRPELDADTLQSYQGNEVGSYTLENHAHLLSGHTRELFEAFRREVLALDECISEEFLKLYVAYKAETNFVDVVPQAKRLRLSLNMPFPELDDPKSLCRDITNVGRWGNGDVEVGLSELDELPYIMGLIRQAFERQMDDDV